MLVSYKWLGEYLDLSNISAKDLETQMSLTGIEVEGVEYPAEGLKKIVVGLVKECIPHPDSDHLSICQVDIGEAELSQIVCGAPNVKAGIKVIVALPNSRITGNAKIKKGKMRGVVSNGMICSLQELGYSDSVIPKDFSDGIYYLPEDAKIGDEVFTYLEMDDAIIDLSITPNRADALSIRGVAYEVGAIYRQTPDFHEEVLVEGSQSAAEKITVSVDDENDVPAYQIRVIENVKIAPSPQWLQNRLMNEGIRPINNVVDVTNYILLLFGQPLHAFDYNKLGSQEILVRRAKAGEVLTTLDDVKRELVPENIVITNSHVPVALAGVMGGLDSEIDTKTTTVALEAALFDSVSIRKTSQQFNLRSESSTRFEKGINKATIGQACDAAAAMIATLAGGTVLKDAVKGSEIIAENAVVKITLAKINRALGTELTEAEVNEIFTALGFDFEVTTGSYTVTIPPRRWDIKIEADIVEEVARIYGYDKLPSTLPKGETVAGSLTADQQLTRKLRATLEGSGLSEAISYALTTPEKSVEFTTKKTKLTRLSWPMSEERSVLRQNLISGLLDDVAYNVARKNNNIGLYEIGRVFFQEHDPLKDLPQEVKHLGLAISGEWLSKDWETKVQKVDFYILKGIVENLFSVLGLENRLSFTATAAIQDLHPGRTAEIIFDNQPIGIIGQVHPAVAKSYDIHDTYVAEIDLQTVLAAEAEPLIYQEVSKYPSVSRDIALLVSETVTSGELVNTIQEFGGRFLTTIDLFDVYQGTNIEAGKKSLAYSLTFVNHENTLTDEEINQAMEKITKNLIENYEAEIR